jgi:iron complex transport system permease protein
LLTLAVSFGLGRNPVAPGEIFGIVASKVFDIEPFWSARTEIILMNIRLPRILLACMVGGSLSAAGASYQSIFQNAMASPDILGASAGAAFGAALAIVLKLGSMWVTAFAFLFSLLAVALVMLAGRRIRGKHVLGLVLSGIMIGALFSAGTSFIKLVADPADQLPAITYWLMGSLASARLSDVAFAIWPMLLGIVPMLLLRYRINLLAISDDEARAIGVNTRSLRMWLIVSSTLLTAASVSVSGTIGFVGLVIPHLSRRLTGSDYCQLLPFSMIFGALFMLLADNVSRNLFATEIPLGIITAIVGVPLFLSLHMRGGKIT